MANLSDFYLIVYFMAAVGSVVTAVVTWWLCLIMKKGTRRAHRNDAN